LTSFKVGSLINFFEKVSGSLYNNKFQVQTPEIICKKQKQTAFLGINCVIYSGDLTTMRLKLFTYYPLKLVVFFFALTGLFSISSSVFSQDPNFYIYLCFGQSNMEGQGTVEGQDQPSTVAFRLCRRLIVQTWEE
jgi:hypothetical protein